MLKNNLLIIIAMIFSIANAHAGISGAAGLSVSGNTSCPPNAKASFSNKGGEAVMTPNVCTISSSSYPPSSDYYRVRSYAYINDNGSTSSVPRETGQFYLDSSKSINQQSINGSMVGNVVVDFKTSGSIEVCSLLVDSFNREYSIPEEPCTGGGYHPPLPPTPHPLIHPVVSIMVMH